MLINFVIIFVFANLCLSKINGDCSIENTKQVIKCYDKYMDKLEHYSFINSFEEYQLSVSYYMENLTKIVALCEEFQTLSTCINNAKANGCINNNDFKAVKTIWNSNSTQYATNYHIMNYMCGKGMKVLTPSYECLKIFPSNSVQCRVHSNDCLTRENEISCFSIAANISCGSNARTFVTNMLQIYLCQTHPECNSCKSSALSILSVNNFFLIMCLLISLIRNKIL